jgi:hypothetical protein
VWRFWNLCGFPDSTVVGTNSLSGSADRVVAISFSDGGDLLEYGEENRKEKFIVMKSIAFAR